jgi:hypothetical protein
LSRRTPTPAVRGTAIEPPESTQSSHSRGCATSRTEGGWFAPEAGHEDLARYGSLDVVVSFIERRLGD